MITYTTGNILEAETEALVNTVNRVGIMGKGIALQFEQAHPDNYAQYVRACETGEVQPGRMFITQTGSILRPHYIINFPTKRHWRGKSRLEDIDAGLEALKQDIRRLGIRSIAVPPLGCGSGGLAWSDVRPRIEQALASLEGVQIAVYAPQGAPAPNTMIIAAKDIQLTRARAMLLLLFDTYSAEDYSLSRLEAQKLAYLLQAAGEPLRLNYVKHEYGPYAHNLNHVLQLMEGMFIRGYGDARSTFRAQRPATPRQGLLARPIERQRDETPVAGNSAGSLLATWSIGPLERVTDSCHPNRHGFSVIVANPSAIRCCDLHNLSKGIAHDPLQRQA